MDNVYQKIALFYEKRGRLKPLVRQAKMERYFRRLAWEGESEASLRDTWSALSVLLDYMLESRLYSFAALTAYDYQEIVYRVFEQHPSAKPDEKRVEKLFDRILIFLIEICGPKSGEVHALSKATSSFYKQDVFEMPDRPKFSTIYEKISHDEEITLEEEDEINEDLAALIDRMEHYFQQAVFERDFVRAYALYAGPYEDASLEDKEDFLYGFWDYFFFDYHMRAEDIPPIRYFYEKEKDILSPEECYILQDLMQARFMVFYVTRMEEDCIFCTDLFSERQMILPIPDNGYMDFKNLILYGHIYPEGIMLLNYVTAAPASKHLRRRIRDEVMAQFETFKKYQMPHAELSDFFVRYGIAVRHTINILANFAKLKVLPNELENTPLRPETNASLLLPEQDLIGEAAAAFGFSAYAAEMAKRIYADYISTVGKREKRSQKALIAAVLLCIQGINGTDYAPPHAIISHLGTTEQAVINMTRKIDAAIGLYPLDPRYRTEEGAVQILYLA